MKVFICGEIWFEQVLSSLEVNVYFKQGGLQPTKGVLAHTSEFFFENKCPRLF